MVTSVEGTKDEGGLLMSARRTIGVTCAALVAAVAVIAGLVSAAWLPSADAAEWPLVKEGHRGPDVTTVQYLVTAHGHPTDPDGQFGPNTAAAVTAFQQAKGLGADGMVGNETWPALVIDLAEGADAPDAVNAAKVQLNKHGGRLALDGVFDAAMADAVRTFQSEHGMEATGVIDAGTWHALVSSAVGDYSLPIARETLPRDEYDDPHHDYPAVDLPVGEGTPVLAINGGEATPVNDSSCGYGVVIQADDGGRYSYCHFRSPALVSGPVATGQHIGDSGNTGNSTGPHLHVGIRRDGVSVCPQPLLLAIYDGVAPPPIAELPTSGCFY